MSEAPAISLHNSTNAAKCYRRGGDNSNTAARRFKALFGLVNIHARGDAHVESCSSRCAKWADARLEKCQTCELLGRTELLSFCPLRETPVVEHRLAFAFRLNYFPRARCVK